MRRPPKLGFGIFATVVCVFAVGWGVGVTSASGSTGTCEPLAVQLESGQATDLTSTTCANMLLNQTTDNGEDDDNAGTFTGTWVPVLKDCDGKPQNC